MLVAIIVVVAVIGIGIYLHNLDQWIYYIQGIYGLIELRILMSCQQQQQRLSTKLV